MLIRKDAIHPPPIEAEDELLNLVKDKIKKFDQKLYFFHTK